MRRVPVSIAMAMAMSRVFESMGAQRDGGVDSWPCAEKEIAVKNDVAKRTAAERERLETIITDGKQPAQRLAKARNMRKLRQVN